METEVVDVVRDNPKCELRLGISSWADGDASSKSIKFASKDKNGKVTRNGEVPVEALGQMLEFAIRHGYIHLNTIRV